MQPKKRKTKDEAQAFLDAMLQSKPGYVTRYCRKHGKLLVAERYEPHCTIDDCGWPLTMHEVIEDDATDRRQARKHRTQLLRSYLE